MNCDWSTKIKTYEKSRHYQIEVAHDDVLAAWTILENLAVSFDQIGAVFRRLKRAADDPKQQKALQAALASYVTPTLVQEINNARMRLGQYVLDEEAEARIARKGISV